MKLAEKIEEVVNILKEIDDNNHKISQIAVYIGGIIKRKINAERIPNISFKIPVKEDEASIYPHIVHPYTEKLIVINEINVSIHKWYFDEIIVEADIYSDDGKITIRIIPPDDISYTIMYYNKEFFASLIEEIIDKLKEKIEIQNATLVFLKKLYETLLAEEIPDKI